jgi:hypothetical protein
LVMRKAWEGGDVIEVETAEMREDTASDVGFRHMVGECV